MKRKEFLKLSASAILLLANGNIVKAADFLTSSDYNKKVKFRFAIASDGHYGQPNTKFEEYFATLVSRINEEHNQKPFAFCVINGDIIHDDKKFFAPAKKALDKLKPKYYVSQGNHDKVNAQEWEEIWNMPVNLDFKIKDSSFLIATTSNEKGEYLCPNISWFKNKLQEHNKQQNVFIFLHINPNHIADHSIECPDLVALFQQYPNIRAVFNGHNHNEDGITTKNNIKFIFDGHFGSYWGTNYRGFRVVELLADNSILTYIMNPIDKINEATLV